MSPTSAYSRPQNKKGIRTVIWTIMICLLCWATAYGVMMDIPFPVVEGGTPLWGWLSSFLNNRLVAYIIEFGLMLLCGFLIHRMNVSVGLIREKGMMPAVFFFLFFSTNFDSPEVDLGLLCLLFIILILYLQFHAYHDQRAVSLFFNASLLLGLCSLLWAQVLLLLPLLWFGMYRFRSLSLRTFGASLLGVIVVYWFVLGWCILVKDFSLVTIPLRELTAFEPADVMRFPEGWLYKAFGILLVLIASIRILTHSMEESYRNRQFLSFLIVMFFFSLLLYVIYGSNSKEFVTIAMVPGSLLVGHLFTVTKGRTARFFFYFTYVVLIGLFYYHIYGILN